MLNLEFYRPCVVELVLYRFASSKVPEKTVKLRKSHGDLCEWFELYYQNNRLWCQGQTAETMEMNEINAATRKWLHGWEVMLF